MRINEKILINQGFLKRKFRAQEPASGSPAGREGFSLSKPAWRFVENGGL
jgi:hypothetical protein